MEARIVDYVHPKLHEAGAAIRGRYVLTHEVRLPFRDREVLYLVGYAVIDTACCGVGGGGYVVVPGFIVPWKYTTNEDGLPISRTEPIRNVDIQQAIRRCVKKRHLITQILFQ